MKHVRLKYIFLLIFTFLFTNLISISVSEVKAETQEGDLDLSNAYRGSINGYWALVNYGESYVGDDTITIFLDPSAIDNQDISYILIAEVNNNDGSVSAKYFKRGVDSSFASRFNYTFVNKGYGNKSITIFLLEDLVDTASKIIDRIDINDIRRVKTIEDLTSVDFEIIKEVEELTSIPYRIFIRIKNNSCDYKLKTITYSYTHINEDGSESLLTGAAIPMEDDFENGSCNEFYFFVSENALYNLTVEDYFGYIKPDEGESLSVNVDNFLGLSLVIVADYDNRLTNQDLPVYVKVYDEERKEYPYSLLETLSVEHNGVKEEIKNLGVFIAKENGVYIIHCKTIGGIESTIEINITNIDREAPIVYVNDYLHINSSDVETRPYIFDPMSYVLATDNMTPGDSLIIQTSYYYVSGADYTCKVYQGNALEYDFYRYLYGVNDVCLKYEVYDEAGNSRSTFTRVVVNDDTKPTVTSSRREIQLEIGDDMPSTDELVERFGLEVNDNSRLFNSNREVIVNGDFSSVDLEELGRYLVYISATDESGNVSDVLTLTVVVTQRILVIDAVPNQYIVYGEPMIEILYTCNGNPCINRENPQDSEILPADWERLSGELYIISGARYSGTYTIYSSLAINSRKYHILEGNLGVFTIKQRTFKIVANSFTIDYKDEEPTLTWYMDTSVCNPDLSTKYTSFEEVNYSCTFLEGDNFGGGAYEYEFDEENNLMLYAGGIIREPGNIVRYDSARNIIYYRITIGDLRVSEASNGGRDNYYLDFYGLYEGALYKDYARFYILPKHTEVTFTNVSKIYGEADPSTTYHDDEEETKYVRQLREDGKSNVQYEFTCWSLKWPINAMTTMECQQEIELVINREEGENVGQYFIIAYYTNPNYEVKFNEEVDRENYVSDEKVTTVAYLNIIPREITIKIDGKNGDGKYSIFYEDPLPLVTFSVTNDPSITYQGLANNVYLNVNNGVPITFADRLSYGSHPVNYFDRNGNRADVVIGGYDEYISGVGTYRIARDTLTIINISGDNVLDGEHQNYNLTFIEGELEVVARQIYIKIVDGLTKIYGDNDPIFTSEDIISKYGDSTNYVVDGSSNFILQIVNTLENSDIVNDEHYEPFDKDKLKYYLRRTNLRLGVETVDIHDGEMVGKYLISMIPELFENDTNYIIDIYQEYYFEITTREIQLTINSNTIEFNYNNIVPKFSYSYKNTAFTDALIGQPSVDGFSGNYRNNGTYVVRMGDILALSSAPVITSVDNIWYIDGVSTNISLFDFSGLDNTLLKIVNNRYQIIDVSNNTLIDTGVEVSKVNVMWNYTFKVNIGFLEVIPRNVIIVPDDGISKQYGDKDKVLTYYVKHAGDLQVEAILDETDFVGYLSRAIGEKPGKYEINQNSLLPASKGASYNFNIVGFETNHYFEITKRTLIIKHAASDENNNVSVFYGDSSLDSIVSGYIMVEGSEAYDMNLCTEETLNGETICDPIYDRIVGSITTDPENPEDVGQYRIINKDLHIVRVINPDIDVSEYYDLEFIEATLTILPRIIYITPDENQSKIYGENDGVGACGITYTYSPGLVKESDVFSGCLARETKTLSDGRETSEDVGEYRITLGTLTVSPNYVLILNGSVMYQIRVRNITITAKVEGENVVKSSNINVYTMTYGDEYTLGYDIGGMGLANNPSLGIADRIVNNVELDPAYHGVGTYLVVQGSLAITNSTNYNLTFERAQFNVNKRQVTIEPYSLSKIYGDSDPSEFGFTIVGDDLPYSGELARLEGENVGRYRIILGTLSFGDNYDINLLEAYFEITHRVVNVVVDPNQGKIYSYDDPVLTYTYSVYNNFTLDTPWLGTLIRDPGEEVGQYLIKQGTLDLNANYQIEFTGNIFEIYYIDFSAIEIYSLTNNQYQTQGDESEVRLYARFNKGADESHLKDVTWSVVKQRTMADFEFVKDANNVISFTPSGSIDTYIVTASYNGISAIYLVYVRSNSVIDIYISLINGVAVQTLGLESEVVYSADIDFYEDTDLSDLVIEWYVSDTRVCEYSVSNTTNYCAFTPNFPVGVYEVYAQIGVVKSKQSLELTIRDNAAPRITLVNQDQIYYIEAFQNATENSIQYIEPGFSASDDVDGDLSSSVVITGVDQINYYKVGTYYIVYEVRDSHGHIANNYRIVVVQDTVAPTVTLNYPELSEIILEYGDEYIEYGAVASDAYDDYYNNPLEVYIDSKLDLTKVGTYEIVYFAVDSNGLRGQTIRIVRIIDSIKPNISLIGDETVYVEYKEKYDDPGAWFDDNYDGRFRIYASSIVFTREGSEVLEDVSSVDTSILGIYRLTYYQEDSSGNPPQSTVIRTVIVRDSTPPIITLLGSNPFILRYGTKYVDPGYKVIDNYDGDITDTELVTVVEVIGDTLGTYYVYYNARDSHNNIAQEVKREVIILDLVSPIIYFTEACPQYITIEAIVEDYDLRCNLPGYGYTVVDDYLPDIDAIQNWVQINGEVDKYTVGTYRITYDVSDRSGNNAVTLIRYVNVVDTTPPSIELLPNEEGEVDFYVEVFSEYIEPGWRVSDIYDDYHHLEILVNTTNNINVNRLNTYTVTYIAIDSNGNQSEPVYRYITVRDTIPPVVTLIGDEEITLERGTPYAEYGATANDNYDGLISQIVISGQPTGMNLGNFEVSYCAKDSSGNEGCTIRLVHVVDTIPPTVLGVEDGHYYRAPLYIYYSPLPGTDEILTGTLNDTLISSPWYVYQENTYHLVVRDDAGNETVIDFAIDMTPPTLLGANDGEYLNHPVTIYSDELLSSITYRVNNGGFVSTSEQSVVFESEGQYWVYATDMAGNVSAMISFVIDMTPPAYTLIGVLPSGITDTDVTLITENDVIVSVNNQYIPTNYTFTENGYYQVTIRDLAGNDVFVQFVINKEPTVVINKQTVTFISQNNAIDQFIAKADPTYPRSTGFIYAKPLLDGTFEYISGKLFSDEEYSKLINGEDIAFDVPTVGEKEMVVAFVVGLDELNKFTTQTVEGDGNGALGYAFLALGVGALIGGFFFIFIIVKRRKEEDEEEESEEVIEDEDNYY